jgi:glycosyltransferase involved in cell wall biosynthesis
MVTLALELKKRGHLLEFFIYYPKIDFFASLLKKADILIHTFEKKSRFSIFPFIALRKLIRERKYDAILSFLSTPNVYAEMARLGLEMPPLVVSDRNIVKEMMFPNTRLPFKIWLMLQLHHFANMIVVNSHYQREKMTSRFPWMKSKILTILNGVDTAMFSTSQMKKSENKPLKLLAVGRIAQQKNVPGLVKALRIYHDCYGSMPIIRWAGKQDRSKSGQENFRNILRLMDKLNVTNNWEWLGERTDIPQLLHESHALIHPSFYEGLPNAVCEALAAGCPVLVSNVCDHPRLVQEGITGFLFEPAQPEEIALAIHRLATLTPTAWQEMGYQARRFAERELSVESFADKYEKLFMDLTQPFSQKTQKMSDRNRE